MSRARLPPHSSRFFSPSYFARPCLSPRSYRLADALNPRASSSRAISFNSNGSSSRPGPRGAAGRINTPRPQQDQATEPTSASASASASPSSPPAPTASAPPAPTKKVTPLAPTLLHASAELVGVDRFFSLHRPLLELPIRLHSRRSVAPVASLEQRIARIEPSAAPPADAEREVKRTADGEEILEVVDLDEHGTPTGPSYMATASAVRAAAQEDRVEQAETDDHLEQLATEAAEADFEDGSSPYERWLIGEPDLTAYTPKVARYLASNQPFVAPPVPEVPAARLSSQPSAAAPSDLARSLSSQTLSDLSFLRPFPTSPAPSARPPPIDEFTKQYLDPLDPSEAAQVTDRFLSNALLNHRWHAFDDYARNAGEKLELARNTFVGTSSLDRRPFEEKRKRGEVRMWSEEEGWVTVDLGAGRDGASPFLPAEMVDLDWEDEQYEIQMDSVKRKRKKKITKHKYKKRRKAQKALRQRLGK